MVRDGRAAWQIGGSPQERRPEKRYTKDIFNLLEYSKNLFKPRGPHCGGVEGRLFDSGRYDMKEPERNFALNEGGLHLRHRDLPRDEPGIFGKLKREQGNSGPTANDIQRGGTAVAGGGDVP